MKLDYSKIPLVFNVYKPIGPSSFQIVHHFKKNLNYDFGKIGHFGTLDPFAEGVLLVGVQGAQRLNELVHRFLPKTYRAIGIFGQKTDSGDLTGTIQEKKHIEDQYQHLERADLEEFFCSHFLGEYWQSPHSISATKHEGKRLYKLALQGKVIVKDKVKREIYDFQVHRYEYPLIDFSVTVSSGTYVRSLFEEMANLFGGLGALRELKRTKIGDIDFESSLKKEQWPIKNELFDLETNGLPIDQLLRLKKIYLNFEQSIKFARGYRLPIDQFEVKTDSQIIEHTLNHFWVYSSDGDLLGIAREDSGLLIAIFNLRLIIDKILNEK